MEIKRFFVDKDQISNGKVTITGDEHIHLSTSLRFRVGYKLIVCDDSGLDYLCTVDKITSSYTLCTVDQVLKNQTEHKVKIILLIGIIKPDKFEIAIQKAVELGVNTIIPFYSSNTDERKIRMDRLNRIIFEACKQCGRAVLPKISEPMNYEEALRQGEGIKIIAYEKESALSLKKVLTEINDYNCVTFVVGSEGGFNASEIEFATKSGYTSVSLGKRILRAETAVISGLSNISLFLED